MRSLLDRDERELAVDRAGDRLAYLVLSYGLLLIVAYRAFVDGQPSWELLALVVAGGVVGAAYRIRQRTATREALLVVGITILAAAVVALLVVVAGGA
jgi:1,4-dihydroxy-2-naphthoate octaprenyltransferase